jgi:hypothetical protein
VQYVLRYYGSFIISDLNYKSFLGSFLISTKRIVQEDTSWEGCIVTGPAPAGHEGTMGFNVCDAQPGGK